MKKIISAAILAILLMSQGTLFAADVVTDAESGMKYKEALTETETEPEITLHETVYSPYFKLPSPSIYSTHTEKERQIADDADIYVSADGSDTSGDGSFENPYASLDRARLAVVELKASGYAPEDGIVVAFKAGVYPVSSTVNFSSADSGSETCPVVYTAYGDGEVLFKGSMTLDVSDFSEVEGAEAQRLQEDVRDKIRVIDLKKYGITSNMLTLNQIGSASYRGTNAEVSVDREVYTLAQYPNRDEKMLTTVSIISRSPAEYYITGADMERAKGWSADNDVWAMGMLIHEYTDSTTPVSFNYSKGSVKFTRASSEGGHQINYIFFNVFEELDDPGEWYLDRENCLMYIYPNTELQNASVELTLGMTNTFINLNNCDYVTFDGLNFTGTRGGGLSGSNCDYVTVNDCDFYAIFGKCIDISNSYHCTISNCDLSYIGESGITISGGVKSTLTKSYNLIDNNSVTHWALYKRSFTPAISGQGQGITVSHNEIAYSTSSAVGLTGNLNYFEYNTVHDCTTLANDCGAFYNGSSWTAGKNVIRYNMFYNIGTAQKSPAAIYWDDGMAYQSAYCNLILNVGGHGFSIGGGFGQNVVNNIVVNTRGCACLYDARPYSGNRLGDSFYALGNGFLWNLYKSTPYTSTVWRENFPLLSQILQDNSDKYAAHFGYNPAFSLMCDNVYLNKSKSSGGYGWGPVHYSAVVDNYLNDLSVLDDVFVDWEHGDYRLREDSAAFETVRDFIEIPYHLIGRY